MLDWNDLRFFLAVARSGSTAAAGRFLAVNQSTVVRRVAALEQALGLRLFERRREGYRLTAAGATLLPQAEAVEAAVQTLHRQATALDQELTGTLRVTTAEGMAFGLVPQLLNAFRRRHPGIRVELVIDDRYHSLSDGRAEVALRAGPPGDGRLVGRKLSDQAWALYGSRDYVASDGRPVGVEDLARHRLIGFEGAIEDITPARWLRSLTPPPEIAVRSNSVMGLLFAIQSGSGLGLLPCQIGDQERELVRVLDPQPGLTAGFWILTHPELRRQPKVRAFFDFMAEAIVACRPLLLGQTAGATATPAQRKPSALEEA